MTLAKGAGERPISPREPGFYEDAKRGYYWYEVYLEEEETEESDLLPDTHPAPDTKPFDDLWTMHPDDFQAYVDQVQKYAIQYPTEENVARYFYVNMVSAKKSKAFASVASLVAQTHPKLTTDQTYPLTSPGRRAMSKIQHTEKDSLLLKAKDDYALILFVQARCDFCDSQKGIMRFFVNKYDWPVRYLDIHDHSDFAAEVGVEMTPTLILIKKGEKDIIPIASGVLSLNDMTQRIYRSVRLLEGDIMPEQLDIYDYELNTPADPLTDPLTDPLSGRNLKGDRP